MKRLNFTFDADTVELLERLADTYYGGNKSATVRAALESLAVHVGHEGWVVTGYAPINLHDDATCHSCGTEHHSGDVLFRPVFERGTSPNALPKIPKEEWLDCSGCVEQRFSAQA